MVTRPVATEQAHLQNDPAEALDYVVDPLKGKFSVDETIEMPKTSFESLIAELRFLRALVSRDRAGYYAVRTDLFEKLYEEAQSEEEKSYVDWLLNTATILSVSCNAFVVFSIASPESLGYVADKLGSLNPFHASKLADGNYNAPHLTKAASKMFSQMGRAIDSGKQWRETSRQGTRLQASNCKDRNKLRLDRCQNEESTAWRDVNEGFRGDDEMRQKRDELVRILSSIR